MVFGAMDKDNIFFLMRFLFLLKSPLRIIQGTFQRQHLTLTPLRFHTPYRLLLLFFNSGSLFHTLCFYVINDWDMIWRPPYPLYDGRRTHYTTTAERCVPRPPYSNPYNVIGLKQHRKHEKETSETYSVITVNFR